MSEPTDLELIADLGARLGRGEIIGQTPYAVSCWKATITLLEQLQAIEAERDGLRKALVRLGSMEAFEGSRSIDKDRDRELLARIDFARAHATGEVRDALREALTGFGDDYMTSEAHHPGYVLIPTAKFEEVRSALSVPVEPQRGDRVSPLIDELDGVISDLESSEWARAPQCIKTLRRVAAALSSSPAGPDSDTAAVWKALPQFMDAGDRVSAAEVCPICEKPILPGQDRATGYYDGEGPVDFHHACEAPDVTAPLDAFWARMLEVDDRNSPEEYPEMILVTYDEVKRAMVEAVQAHLPASPSVSASPLPDDVVRLVIAARKVAFITALDPDAVAELDAASEAFADRVAWEDEPEEADEDRGCNYCRDGDKIPAEADYWKCPRCDGEWWPKDAEETALSHNPASEA